MHTTQECHMTAMLDDENFLSDVTCSGTNQCILQDSHKCSLHVHHGTLPRWGRADSHTHLHPPNSCGRWSPRDTCIHSCWPDRGTPSHRHTQHQNSRWCCCYKRVPQNLQWHKDMKWIYYLISKRFVQCLTMNTVHNKSVWKQQTSVKIITPISWI